MGLTVTFLRWLAIVTIGTLAPLTWWWLTVTSHDAVVVGPWRASLAAGAAQADMQTRAYVAITGLLALNRSETLYFNADQDDQGRRLAAECAYDILGSDLPARWWSLTAYAGDHFLIPNTANRYSFSMRSLERQPDGRFLIAAGPNERPGNWLPTGARGAGLSFLIRLYNPQAEAVENPGQIPLPSIRRVGDCP